MSEVPAEDAVEQVTAPAREPEPGTAPELPLEASAPDVVEQDAVVELDEDERR